MLFRTPAKFAIRLGGAVEAFGCDSRAAGAVEFALLAPFVIAVVFVTLMVSVLYLAKSQLDAATQTGARAVMTGQATTTQQLQDAICKPNNIPIAMFDCSKLMISINTYQASWSNLANANLTGSGTKTPTLTYNANGTVANTWNANFGAAGSIMVLQVLYQFPVIAGQLFSFDTQGNGNNLLISTAVFIREQ